MNKFVLRKCMQTTKTEYVKWITNPRMILVAVVMVFLYQYTSVPLLGISVQMDSPLNVLEPFIAIANSQIVLLIVPVVLLTLLADFPRVDGNTLFYVMRTGSLNWMAGQILFSLLAIISFIGFLFVGSVVPMLAKGFWGNQWSLAVTGYAKAFPEQSRSFAANLITSNLHHQMSPFHAGVVSYLLLIAYLFLMVLILMLCHLLQTKLLGLLTVYGIVALGTTLCLLGSNMMWWFPMANSFVFAHFTKYYREPIVPLSHSVLYFTAISALLIGLCVWNGRKIEFDKVMEVD